MHALTLPAEVTMPDSLDLTFNARRRRFMVT